MTLTADTTLYLHYEESSPEFTMKCTVGGEALGAAAVLTNAALLLYVAPGGRDVLNSQPRAVAIVLASMVAVARFAYAGRGKLPGDVEPGQQFPVEHGGIVSAQCAWNLRMPHLAPRAPPKRARSTRNSTAPLS